MPMVEFLAWVLGADGVGALTGWIGRGRKS